MKRLRILLVTSMLLLPSLVLIAGSASANEIPLCCVEDPSLIVIDGPGNSDPIEISDPRVLSAIKPWMPDFANRIDDTPDPPSSLDEAYQVFVHSQQGHDEFVYMFYYYPNVTGDHGFVYFPGRGEEYYETNAFLVVWGWEGEWRRALPPVDRALRPVIERTYIGERQVQSSSPSQVTTLIAGLLILTTLVGAALLAKKTSKDEMSSAQ